MEPSTQYISATMFATMPDHYRLRGKRSAWADAHKLGGRLDCYLEGPAFDRQGNLFVVDVAHSRIFRISPQGVFDLACEYDGLPYSLKIHRDGRIFVADFKRGLMSLDPATGAVSDLLDTGQQRAFKGINDLVFAQNGDLYFTDYGRSDLNDPSGRVYRLTATGNLDCLTSVIAGPNGLVLNRAENHLYIAATRSNEILRFILMPDGAAEKLTTFVRLSGGVGPDGMAADESGNVFVAHAGRGLVWGFNAQGEIVYKIASPVGLEVSNLAFGGNDRRTLFITEGDGHILSATLDAPGIVPFSHLP